MYSFSKLIISLVGSLSANQPIMAISDNYSCRLTENQIEASIQLLKSDILQGVNREAHFLDAHAVKVADSKARVVGALEKAITDKFTPCLKNPELNDFYETLKKSCTAPPKGKCHEMTSTCYCLLNGIYKGCKAQTVDDNLREELLAHKERMADLKKE